jgi:hypothetical protein
MTALGEGNGPARRFPAMLGYVRVPVRRSWGICGGRSFRLPPFSRGFRFLGAYLGPHRGSRVAREHTLASTLLDKA